MRVEHHRHALGVAEEHEVAPEEMQRHHVADRQLVRIGHAEPAVRVGRKREAVLHACLGASADGAPEPNLTVRQILREFGRGWKPGAGAALPGGAAGERARVAGG